MHQNKEEKFDTKADLKCNYLDFIGKALLYFSNCGLPNVDYFAQEQIIVLYEGHGQVSSESSISSCLRQNA